MAERTQCRRTNMHAGTAIITLFLAVSCGALALNPPLAAAQSPTSPQGVVTSLSAAVDAIQARLDAGDAAGARLAYLAFENTWLGDEHVVRTTSGVTAREIEQAMADLR